MFNVFYKKNKNKKLFKSLQETHGLSKIQNYIPIYKLFFELTNDNFQNINLNQQYNITTIGAKEKDNSCLCVVERDGHTEKRKTFVKYSPLIDPIKFMVGKYNSLDEEQQTNLPQLTDNICHSKTLTPNNSAYVDSFFSYLTSHLLHKHKFLHGLDFYGSFLAIKADFDINIMDDLEYLYDSSFFHEKKGKLFSIDPLNEEFFFDADTRNCKHKLNISTSISEKSVKNLPDFEDIFEINQDLSNNTGEFKPRLVFEQITETSSFSEKKKCSDSTCSSRSSHTTGSDTETDDEEDNEETGSLSGSSSGSDSSDIICKATIYNYPVQAICLEYMQATLDSLLNTKKGLDTEEWRSCLFQIVMILITYQKVFSFTHNDLHTNNIMFTTTDKVYLIYKYNKKLYKVPTYGRIFKLIDFGRAIYKFQGKNICSDSFHPEGDAATQYNCEPFYNKKKPRIEPNFSFDLCRLACSLFDYFMEEEDDDDEDAYGSDPIKAIITEWCTDDKGRNILYKKCGEERYPDFKLYKMIVRTVHKHTPQHQVEKPIFRKYATSRKKIKKKPIFNIDSLPSYV